MSKSKNPLEALANMYKEFVDKEDKKGLAEVYKESTELVFKEIKKQLKEKDIVAKIINVKYLDGYFIFGTGTNSVVHFNIDITPGWKYGIWWSPAEDKEKSTEDITVYDPTKLRCSIFAQFEEEIDKFKPSASTYSRDFDINLTKDFPFSYGLDKFIKDIKFIHNEPCLAFYLEMHCVDFNQEHVTREEAKEYFDKHFEWKRKSEEIKSQNNKEFLLTMYNVLKEDIDNGDVFIHDNGKHWSPRYGIIGKNTYGSDVEDGCYDICDLYDNGEEIQKIIDSKVKECEDRADEHNVHWFRCCYDSINLISPERYDKAFNECEKIDFNNLEV